MLNATETGISSGLMSHLGSYTDFTNLTYAETTCSRSIHSGYMYHAFWSCLGQLCPQYKQQSKLLSAHSTLCFQSVQHKSATLHWRIFKLHTGSVLQLKQDFLSSFPVEYNYNKHTCMKTWLIIAGLNRISTHDLCDSSAVLYQLSYQSIVIWILINKSRLFAKKSTINWMLW